MISPLWVLWMIAGGMCKLNARGKSGLHRAMQGVTPLAGNRRNSGTERISRAMSSSSGTGELKHFGASRCGGSCWSENSQTLHEARSNREALSTARASFRVGSPEYFGNEVPRGMIIHSEEFTGTSCLDRIRLTVKPNSGLLIRAIKRCDEDEYDLN